MRFFDLGPSGKLFVETGTGTEFWKEKKVAILRGGGEEGAHSWHREWSVQKYGEGE